jgi:hypothetical protein
MKIVQSSWGIEEGLLMHQHLYNYTPSLLTSAIIRLRLFLRRPVTSSISTVSLSHQRLVVDELYHRSIILSGTHEAPLKLRCHADVAADHVIKELDGDVSRGIMDSVEQREDERSELHQKLLLPPHGLHDHL